MFILFSKPCLQEDFPKHDMVQLENVYVWLRFEFISWKYTGYLKYNNRHTIEEILNILWGWSILRFIFQCRQTICQLLQWGCVHYSFQRETDIHEALEENVCTFWLKIDSWDYGEFQIYKYYSHLNTQFQMTSLWLNTLPAWWLNWT